MRFRLLRRRLTISAPTMAIRSRTAWPLRWLLVALVLGFCAAVALWAFEFGKSIAGLDSNAKEELDKLRQEVLVLREERDKAQSVSNTSGSLLIAEKTAQEQLALHTKQLEAENRALRDDLGFFEKLMPVGGNETLSIRGLQAERLGDTQLKWQILVIQPVKNAPEFNGKLELSLGGTLDGKPWVLPVGGGVQAIQVKQYRRLEGVVDLPAQVVVKTFNAKVTEGSTTRALQSLKL
jgi:hypothetical protein